VLATSRCYHHHFFKLSIEGNVHPRFVVLLQIFSEAATNYAGEFHENNY
jgi:hypothetical protein